MSTSSGVWVAALLTIFAYSYLYKDNPMFKFAEHLFVGIGAAQAIVMGYQNIVEQAWKNMSKGPVNVIGRRLIRPPKGEAYHRIECPKGDFGFHLISEGGPQPYRCRIRSAGMMNLTALKHMVIGHKIQDLVIIFGSLNVTVADIDR